MEGRPPGKAGMQSLGPLPQPPQPTPQGVMIYQGGPGGSVMGMHGGTDGMQGQVMPRRTEGDKPGVEEPVMASLQKPDDQGI